MGNELNIVQLRATIFLQQNVFYTPENAKVFKELLMRDGEVYGLRGTSVNPIMPQYGMPWRLSKRVGGGEYNVIFQMGRIDVIQKKEVPYDRSVEVNFCEKSIDWVTKIIKKLGNIRVSRVAYAPTFVCFKDEETIYGGVWEGLLKKTMFNSVPMRDINLSFVTKGELCVNGDFINLNLFHNVFDGIRDSQKNNEQRKVLMIQLDINSVPEKILELDNIGVEGFFSRVLSVNDELIANVTGHDEQ